LKRGRTKGKKKKPTHPNLDGADCAKGQDGTEIQEFGDGEGGGKSDWVKAISFPDFSGSLEKKDCERGGISGILSAKEDKSGEGGVRFRARGIRKKDGPKRRCDGGIAFESRGSVSALGRDALKGKWEWWQSMGEPRRRGFLGGENNILGPCFRIYTRGGHKTLSRGRALGKKRG